MKTTKSNPMRNVDVESLVKQFKFAVKRFGLQSKEAENIAAKLSVLAPHLFTKPRIIGKVKTKQATPQLSAEKMMQFSADANTRERN